MADWKTLTPELRREWNAWLATRPPEIQELAKRFPPWKLFRLHKNRVRVQSYGENEDGTLSLTVAVDARFGIVTMERAVFGVSPEDLAECDLPAPDELVGCIGMTPEEMRDLLPTKREAVIHFRTLTTHFKTFSEVEL